MNTRTYEHARKCMNTPGPTGRTTKGDNAMRKVTAEAAAAFCAGQSMNVQNTTVTANADGGATMRLHGNVIARMNADRSRLTVTLAGWGTPTTRERLNGLLAVWCNATDRPPRFWQENNEQMFACDVYSGPTDDSADLWTVDRAGRLLDAHV